MIQSQELPVTPQNPGATESRVSHLQNKSRVSAEECATQDTFNAALDSNSSGSEKDGGWLLLCRTLVSSYAETEEQGEQTTSLPIPIVL